MFLLRTCKGTAAPLVCHLLMHGHALADMHVAVQLGFEGPNADAMVTRYACEALRHLADGSSSRWGRRHGDCVTNAMVVRMLVRHSVCCCEPSSNCHHSVV